MQVLGAFLMLFSVLCLISWGLGKVVGVMTADPMVVNTADESKDADLIQVKQSSRQKQAIQDVEINAMEVQQARNGEDERNRLHYLHDIDMEVRDREYEEWAQAANASETSQPWEN